MRSRAFTDEEEDSSAEDSPGGEPEYSFAGFNVEFSEKIALTPAAAQAEPRGAAGTPGDGRTN